ncbi:unnamed protein product [Peronospora destructor]|uniref:PARP-type domain-containing protein n=1 Tax=Peronospora destructor TaxID=86335 RepID=A0AAV0SV40_9STRA|nr:unnamed protein product [Peronospora destructor]
MKLRMLTFNLFFDEVARFVRMKAVGRLVETTRPAVIGFQEVTRETLKMLKAQNWAKYYDCSVDTAPPFQETYFVVLFSALPVKSLETHPFANTSMGRELVFMHIEPIPGKTLIVGTSHLESLPKFAGPRVSQLKESLTLLRDRVNNAENDDAVRIGTKRPYDENHTSVCMGAVFMGDTNLMRADMKLLDRRLAEIADLDMEFSKTGRARCRTCGDPIDKGVVRVGKMMKEKVAGGKVLEIRRWLHVNCFLSTPSTTEEEKMLMRRKKKQLYGEEPDDGKELDMATIGLPNGWKDLWLSVPGNTEENGYTFDGTRNTLVTSRSFRSRLDRMYFYSAPTEEPVGCVFDDIVIVGQAKIADRLWLSDHFGLLSTFVIREEDEKNDASKKSGSKKARRTELGLHVSSTRSPILIE